MQERNKNKKSSLSDFIRYRDDKMKDEERNAFERELQKDPFFRDASEGLESITPDEALEDLSDLQKKLKKKVNKRQRVLFYSIAASVAVLMVISSIFILVERNRTPEQIASAGEHVKPSEIIKSVPSTVQADKSEISEPEGRISEKKRQPALDQKLKPVLVQQPAPVDKSANVKDQINDSISEIKVYEAEEYITSDEIAAVAVAPATAKRKTDKTVVTSYDVTQGDEARKEAVQAGYVPPQPAAGKSNYDNYIRKNLHRPDSMTTGQKEDVILSFRVHTDGSLDSIRIIKSPGKLFSDEAVRLVRSGPAWKPAEENGLPVEDEVRLKIVFE